MEKKKIPNKRSLLNSCIKEYYHPNKREKKKKMEKKTNEERKKGLKQKRKIERKHKKTRKETGNMC